MSLRWTEEEYEEWKRGKVLRSAQDDTTGKVLRSAQDDTRGKYGNKRIEVDGLKFDSRHEADYYFGVLLPLWKGGALVLLARQVPFDLPGGIRYIADFVTVDKEGVARVIDAKSVATRKNRVYINKRKQMKAIWGIEIEEV